MGRPPCCTDISVLKKGPWTPEEDEKLTSYIQKHGHGSWRALPKAAGLNRCGKSCRLRWMNYLRPDIKRGQFSKDEEDMIIKLHSVLGNKWSRIAAHFSGRTDNEIKNYWNTHLRKKLLEMGIDPVTHKPRTDLNLLANLTHILSSPPNINLASLMNPNWDIINNSLRLQPNVAELAKLQVLNNIFQILSTSNNSLPTMDQLTSSNLGFPINNVNGLGNINPIMCSTSQTPISYNKQDNDGAQESWQNLDTSNSYCKKISLRSSYNNTNSTIDDNKLPLLVNLSPGDSIINQPESNTNSTVGSSTLTPTGVEFFEGWEKLLDDGNSDLFWKQFLS